MGNETAIKKDELKRLVAKYISVEDLDSEIEEFYNTDKPTTIRLKDDGFIAYSEEEDYIFWWYLYDAGILSNLRKTLKIAKKMEKKILYTGKTDFYRNNSIKIEDNLYQLML